MIAVFVIAACSDDATSPPSHPTDDGGANASSSSGGVALDSGDESTTVFIGCCNGVCVDTNTSNEHCGACDSPCNGTEQCTNGSCRVRLGGNGADGAFAPTADAVIDNTRSGATGEAGAKVVFTTGIQGFAVGQVVLIHQTRGAGAGKWELGNIASIDNGASSITLARPLASTYTNAGAFDRAQVVKVEQYTSVDIPDGVTVRAPAWDGNTGGILAFKATGAVNVAGAIAMDGAGFRGPSHAAACAGGTRYFCTNQDTADGFTGESPFGPSGAGNGANGSGGGGGQDGQDCAAGGGGSYGAAGAKGTDGAVDGACRAGAQLGGAPGGVVGDANLDANIVFGGAGGEGGADEDGAYPGAGGNGGGIIVIAASSITVAASGSIRANGSGGSDGAVSGACGGAGCGMGGGGGGAGGAIQLRASGVVDLGDGRVTATGAGGGVCSCSTAEPGGSGGAGRIGVSGTTTGTTNPTFAPN